MWALGGCGGGCSGEYEQGFCYYKTNAGRSRYDMR
jgi:hypothetical protein